ncbi:negative regulation of transcription, DNA-templated [Homalodisca vitripennis]|nr:negative regulation of transcription, DNA-templated [Homalodisca vitripennis]
MERMEVDEDSSVVDLSLPTRRENPPMTAARVEGWGARRSLRPRTELRSYAESPDVVVVTDDEPRLNGYTNGSGSLDSDSDDGEMPPLPPIKELSPAEVLERERVVRRLREELRNEEMKLVLLKKLRQSQQMKENIAVVPPTTAAAPPAPSPQPSKPPVTAPPPPPLLRNKPPASPVPHLLRGQPPPARSGPSVHAPPPTGMMLAPQSGRSLAPGMPPSMHPTTPTLQRGSSSSVLAGRGVGLSFSTERTKDSRHSPAPPPSQQYNVVAYSDSNATLSQWLLPVRTAFAVWSRMRRHGIFRCRLMTVNSFSLTYCDSCIVVAPGDNLKNHFTEAGHKTRYASKVAIL